MDIDLTQSIAQVSSAMKQRATADAVGVAVLKKAMDTQEAAAATLIGELLPQTTLATEGQIGTQVNAWV